MTGSKDRSILFETKLSFVLFSQPTVQSTSAAYRSDAKREGNELNDLVIP